MPGRLDGLAQTQATVNRKLRAAGNAGKRELIEFCLAVMGLGARKAPVDLGDLRGGFVIEINGERWAHAESDSSGAVRVIQDRNDVPAEQDRITVRVGTSGIPYAAIQHERMDFQHPKGGEAKYLENALNELIPTLFKRIDEAVRKGARDG